MSLDLMTLFEMKLSMSSFNRGFELTLSNLAKKIHLHQFSKRNTSAWLTKRQFYFRQISMGIIFVIRLAETRLEIRKKRNQCNFYQLARFSIVFLTRERNVFPNFYFLSICLQQNTAKKAYFVLQKYALNLKNREKQTSFRLTHAQINKIMPNIV